MDKYYRWKKQIFGSNVFLFMSSFIEIDAASNQSTWCSDINLSCADSDLRTQCTDVTINTDVVNDGFGLEDNTLIKSPGGTGCMCQVHMTDLFTGLVRYTVLHKGNPLWEVNKWKYLSAAIFVPLPSSIYPYGSGIKKCCRQVSLMSVLSEINLWKLRKNSKSNDWLGTCSKQ